MNTRRSKRRFLAAVLCFATLFAIVLGNAGVKPVEVRAASEYSVNVGSEETTSFKFGSTEATPTLTVIKNEDNTDVTSSITTWESYPSGAATVDTTSYKVSFTKAGKITITAINGEESGSREFTVQPVVSDITLANAKAGKYYEVQLTTTSSDSAVTWTRTDGSLPDGMSLSTDGKISGKPTSKTTTAQTFKVKATVGGVESDEKVLSISVDAPDAATGISLENTEDGTEGISYSSKLIATTSDTPITWSVTDPNALPNGLSLSGDTISGTPTTAGTYNFEAVADNGADTPAKANLTITINKPITNVEITGHDKKAAVGGTNVTLNYTVDDNASKYDLEWKSSDTNIATVSPSDTTSKTGNIIVTGKKEGTVYITATAKDAGGKSVSVPVSVFVPTGSITIAPDENKTIAVGETLTFTPTYKPKTGITEKPTIPTTVEWKANTNDVVTLTDSNGIATVTGKTAGKSTTLTISIKAEDNDGTPVSATSKTITVSADKPLIKTTSPLKDVVRGEVVNVVFEASGPTSKLKWEDVDKTKLPKGLEFKDGKLVGTVAADADLKKYTFVVKVVNTDNTSLFDERTFELTVTAEKFKVDFAQDMSDDDDIKNLLFDNNALEILKKYAEYIASQNAGKTLEVIVHVEAKDPDGKLSGGFSTLAETIKKKYAGVKSEKLKKHYLEIYVENKIDGKSEKPSETKNQVLEIPIKVDFKKVHDPMTVMRFHNNSVKEFTALSKRGDASTKDGYYYYDEKNNILYLYSDKYSPFAVAYPTVDTYTVKFDSNGGSAIDPIIVQDSGTIPKPTDPTRSGYTFGGWYTDEALTKAWNFSTGITDDMTLYAKWTSGTSNSDTSASTATTTTTTTAAEGGRGVNSPQTSDRMWALWGVIIFVVALNGAYIVLAARRGKKK